MHASETQCSHTVLTQNSSVLTEYKDIPEMASMQDIFKRVYRQVSNWEFRSFVKQFKKQDYKVVLDYSINY